MPERHNPDNQPETRRFIHEKIVKPKLTRIQILRRMLFLGVSAVLFGFLAAVTFAVSEPLARKYLVKEESTESLSSISIPKDDPETTSAPVTQTQPPETTTEETQETTEPLEEVVRSEMERYQFTAEDLLTMYAGMNELVQETNNGIVTVHSVKTQTDWFNNPIEISGLYAGAVIASTAEEILILTPREAVLSADALEVTLPDGTSVYAQLKGADQISGMAVLTVPGNTLEKETEEKFKVLELGNSYSVKPGDLVFAAGCPVGIVYSNSLGSISYVAKNVSVIDGTSRLLYTSAAGIAARGTFLFNARGQIIGWATDDYSTEGNTVTVVRALSDYKAVLEKLSNGIPAPYFGIMGQEVPESKQQEGMPVGIYISRAINDGPAYNAGIQSGDILTRIGESSTATMRDFQNCLDKLTSGETVTVEVERFDREEYVALEYEVTIGTR